jgi:glutamate racemase
VSGDGPAAGDGELHLLLADSGLGGLAVCAALERRLRSSPSVPRLRLTFFNAAPEPGRGYNDLPDLPARAALLDRTLEAMEALRPDRIVLACNTLSVLYEHTERARGVGGAVAGAARRSAAGSARPQVTGILEAGLRMFADALAADSGGVLLLLGTRTTIESGVHRRRLLELGWAAERIGALPCHGLARSIEADPAGPAVRQLVRGFAARVPELGLRGERLYAGLACTHYGFIAGTLEAELQAAAGLPVRLLNPNQALAEVVASAAAREAAAAAAAAPAAAAGAGATRSAAAAVQVRVLSKVPLAQRSVEAVAGILAADSDLTARALLSYTLLPDLF